MSTALDALIGVCFALTVAFIVLYAARSRWQASGEGRNVMTFMSVLGLLFGLRLWARLVGPLGDGPWVVTLAALAGVLGWRLVLLVRAQRRQ